MREHSPPERSSTDAGQPRPALRASDEELIAEFQKGDERAFTQLVGRYKNQLMNYAVRYLGDHDEADDVVQETFIRIFRNPRSYRPVAKFSTWIYTIATNLSRTRLRSRRRHAAFSIGGNRPGEARAEPPASGALPDRIADSGLLRQRIEDALAAIPEEFREVVVLCDIQELSYEEAAEITGINIGTVKSRLHRGRERLRELLRDVAPEFLNDQP